MPTLIKTFDLTVTPEQFLNACSANEIQELHLLLQSKRFDSSFSEYSEELQEIPMIYNKEFSESVKAGTEFKYLYDQCVKLFGDNPEEVLNIINQIKDESKMCHMKVIPMMPHFKKLEALRVKHLVAKPQEKIEE